MTSFLFFTTCTLLVTVSVLLILLVLVQKGRGGGLSSAFSGGGAGGHTAFGSKTGDVLTWTTAILFGVFILLAVYGNLRFDAQNASVTHMPTASVLPSPGTKATAPGQPGSSLPPAPVTADPGVANPPAAAPVPNSVKSPVAPSAVTPSPTTKP